MPGRTRRGKRGADPFRRIVAIAGGDFIIIGDLARLFRGRQQFTLKPAIGDIDQLGDDIGIGFPAQIGNPVFGDDDIAAMARDCVVRIGPDDIRHRLAARGPHRIDGDDETRAVQGKGLFGKVELTANAAHHLAVTGRIGDDGAKQCDHHGAIDETRINARPPPLIDTAIERIGEADRPHLEAFSPVFRHGAQRSVEIAAFQEEGGVQHGAIDLALQHIRLFQLQETIGQHFAGTIETGLEGFVLAGQGFAIAGMQGRRERRENVILLLAQDQPLGDGIADRTDADLQRAAIGHQPCRLQADRLVGQADRAFRGREQLEIRRFAIEHMREFMRAHQRRLAAHEGHLRIHLADQHEVGPALGPRLEQIGRDVGIAAQAVERPGIACLFCHQLANDIDAAIENIALGIGIIGANIILLRPPDAAPAPGKEEEFIDPDIVRQRTLAQRRRIGQRRIGTKQPLHRRFEKAPLQPAAERRPFQGERRENRQIQGGIGHCPRHQGIDDMIGFAQPERQGQHDPSSDRINDRIGNRIRTVMMLWCGWHGMSSNKTA